MQNAFCVILSKYRLYQGIALYRSLERNCRDFTMYILCVDTEAYQICSDLNLEKAILIKEEDIGDERLPDIKKSRRLNEYCWTLKPFFIKHVLSRYEHIENVVSLDADIFFFSSPEPMFTNQKDYSVLLSEHNYMEKDMGVENICGKYNSGFIIFKNCSTSLELLDWWKEKCIEWCFDASQEGRFGDQKYLDSVKDLFEGVQSITTRGVNIAPWNEERYRFSRKMHKVLVNDSRLICYHFCGFRLLNSSTFALIIGNQCLNPIIHTPYTIILKHVINDIEKIAPGFDGYSLEAHFTERAKSYKL